MAQQQQQQGGGDNSFAPVWITIAIFIVAYLIWKFAHGAIVAFLFDLNILQTYLVQLFVDDPVLNQALYLMETLDPNSVSWDQLMELSTIVGDYSRYPAIGVFLILSAFLYKSDIRLKFKKTHSMSSLRQQEQHNWPAIMPVVKEDLVATDIDTGPWAMALSPMEFARKYKLLRKDDALLDNPVPGEEMTAGIRRGDAKRVFTLQLGPYWDGFDRCPMHAKALAAVFLARVNRDRDSANTILHTIDKTFAKGNPNYSIATATLRKYQNTERAQEIMGSHAYLLTAMASLLHASREDGVVPTAEFLWLKVVDRRLWYMLNCIGRQTPFVEVGGPFAHWKAEKKLGGRVLVPMIDEAIRALEIAVKSIKLTPRQMEELEP